MLDPEYLTSAFGLGSMTRMALSNVSEVAHLQSLVAGLGLRQPAPPATSSSSWNQPVYLYSSATDKARAAGGGASAAQTAMVEEISPP